MNVYKVIIDGEVYEIRAENLQQMQQAWRELQQNIKKRKQKNEQ